MREELVQRFDREVSDSEFGRIAGMLKVGIVIGGTTFGIAAAAFCGMAAVALVAAAVDGAGSRGPPAVARGPPAAPSSWVPASPSPPCTAPSVFFCVP